MSAEGKAFHAENAQFGSLAYEDVTRLSEAVYEFERSVLSQHNNISGNKITAEQTGMVLGLARTQARLMNDGSTLFCTFQQAADNKTYTIMQSAVKQSEKLSREFKNAGGNKEGLTRSPASEQEIWKVMSWFSGIEFGDPEANLQVAMEKIQRSYLAAGKSDTSYAGAYSDKWFIENTPQAVFDSLQSMRKNAISDIQNYLLVNWDIWATTSNAVKDSSRYSVGNTFDKTV